MSECKVPAAALNWIINGETGISSTAIWAHMCGVTSNRTWADNPADPGDFSRCMKLLDAVPEWRDRLPEMSGRSPAWRGLVARWAEIESVFKAEVAASPNPVHWSAPATYHLMKLAMTEGAAA
ncbi:hypothetical protein [Methylopila sp. 73B]|uniref:hypothetical protein n=1 Tax=Methylopila sp. 73B TaxID=1120792 RepID=UPI0012DC6148|nr:hypothetical protein [Methylopila sp. 73B]